MGDLLLQSPDVGLQRARHLPARLDLRNRQPVVGDKRILQEGHLLLQGCRLGPNAGQDLLFSSLLHRGFDGSSTLEDTGLGSDLAVPIEGTFPEGHL